MDPRGMAEVQRIFRVPGRQAAAKAPEEERQGASGAGPEKEGEMGAVTSCWESFVNSIKNPSIRIHGLTARYADSGFTARKGALG
jgi:hypothetical protein